MFTRFQQDSLGRICIRSVGLLQCLKLERNGSFIHGLIYVRETVQEIVVLIQICIYIYIYIYYIISYHIISYHIILYYIILYILHFQTHPHNPYVWLSRFHHIPIGSVSHHIPIRSLLKKDDVFHIPATYPIISLGRISHYIILYADEIRKFIIGNSYYIPLYHIIRKFIINH